MLQSIVSKMVRFVAAVTAAVALASAASAMGKGIQTKNVSDHNLALKGYDAVAYFDVGAPVAGKGRFTVVHDGAEYRFSTATNRDKFKASPDKYAPQYGGFCSFGTSVGLKLEVDPEAFAVVDGKLYLNNSPKIHQMWLEDPSGRIKAANKNWRKIRKVAAENLEAIPYGE